MASLIKEPGRDSWKLRWYAANGTRRSFGLGKMNKKVAEQFRCRFEELQSARNANSPLSVGLIEWLDGLGEELHDRLAQNGLAEKRVKRSLGAFCEQFVKSRKGIANATSVRDRQVIALLKEFFGDDRPLDSIGPKDAEEWRNWLREKGNKRDKRRAGLSDNTVRRRTGVASQIFAKAITWKLLRENPFDGLEKSVRENRDRMFFVTWESMLKVIHAAPTREWKALLAFLRLTGCRAPSEVYDLRWFDLDFSKRSITIRSPKLEYLGDDHAVRTCPMFPELVPYLQKLKDETQLAGDDGLAAKVFPVVATRTTNIGTTIAKFVRKAGLKPWPKLLQNLRSSRQTELLDDFPVKDVCDWIGNSPAIMAKHYAQARMSVWDLALVRQTLMQDLATSEIEGSKSGPEQVPEGSKTGPSIDQQAVSNLQQEATEITENYVLLRSGDGEDRVPEGPNQWAKREANCCDFPREIAIFQGS